MVGSSLTGCGMCFRKSKDWDIVARLRNIVSNLSLKLKHTLNMTR